MLVLVFAGSTIAGTPGKISVSLFSTHGNGDTSINCKQITYDVAVETTGASVPLANQEKPAETGLADGIISCNSNIFHAPAGLNDQIFPDFQVNIHAFLNPLKKSQPFTFREPDPPQLV